VTAVFVEGTDDPFYAPLAFVEDWIGVYELMGPFSILF